MITTIRSHKKIACALLVIILLISSYLIVSSRTDTYIGRWFGWKSSGIDDYLLFPSEHISNTSPVFEFLIAEDSLTKQPFTYSERGRTKQATLGDIMSQNNTTAFIIIKEDIILYEDYYNGYTRDSINTSFSIAKSITSLLVGIALDEEYIHNVHDPVTTYIPELLHTDPVYEKITIDHLLSMRSGIQFADHDLPWGDKPKAYYHPSLRTHVLGLTVSDPPGAQFQYNTYNPIILGMVLERVTGTSVPRYFENKIWQPLGMEFDASWSLDSEQSAMAKMESGINARAIDFAKIGRLVLNQGDWNGSTIVSPTWIEQLMQPTDENKVSEFGDTMHYNRGWWIHEPTDTTPGAIAGWGHLGQYLYIFPDEHMIMVRFGKNTGKIGSWPQFFISLAQQLTTPNEPI